VNLLDRYFLKEFLKPLGACLVAFLLCMVVYDLYDNINDFIEAKVSIREIFQYYLILIPSWIVQVMPITLLLSLLYVLSSMSKNGELTAMRASGLDMFRLMTPYFLIGICASMQMLSLNLSWAPIAQAKARNFYLKLTDRNKSTLKKQNRVTYYDVAGNRWWYLSSLDPQQKQATGIEIMQGDEQKQDQRKISASFGVYENGFWRFRNVVICDYRLPLSDPRRIQKLNELEAKEMTEAPRQILSEFGKTKQISTQDLLQNLKYSARLAPKQLLLFKTEFHSRLAFPLGNLVVFLIGVPFGVIGQRRSNFLAIVNAILFFFGYLMASKMLLYFATLGYIPPIVGAWLPNIAFSIFGIWMIRKIS
jgi:lipopolysaccharide export system permease protein